MSEHQTPVASKILTSEKKAPQVVACTRGVRLIDATVGITLSSTLSDVSNSLQTNATRLGHRAKSSTPDVRYGWRLTNRW